MGSRARAMDIAEINRSAWTGDKTLGWFARYEGWSDPGERAAVEWLAPRYRGRRILDIVAPEIAAKHLNVVG